MLASEATPLSLASKHGAQARLFTSEAGQVYITWTEFLNDSTDALQFSKLIDGQWEAPRTIASATNWFVNWADFPALAVFPKQEEKMLVHWLQKRAKGTYDYDIHLSQSADGGQSWSPSFIPHRDSIAAEHGFVSMLPLREDRILLSWLDGRHTNANGLDENGHHNHQGAMTLRVAEVSSNGTLHAEAELDARVCDCCQTSSALTDQGPIVAYRDRSKGEIRDIAVIRRIDGEWQAPQVIGQDNWKIAGCPVNGPSITAHNNSVFISWFSGAHEAPKIWAAFSDDSGAHFGPPIRIDAGKPLGRVATVWLNDKTAAVMWMEQIGDQADIRIKTLTPDGDMSEPIVVAETEASRQSGFPVMARQGDHLYLAWTLVDSLTSVQTAKLEILH